MKKIKVVILLLSLSVLFAGECKVPIELRQYVTVSKPPLNIRDVKRNQQLLKGMCMFLLTFQEGKYDWKMLLVYNPHNNKGPFWFISHDNENTSFDAAVYAIVKYGGGFLSILSSDRRNYKGQDPNRNFSNSLYKVKSCKLQRAASPKYTQTIMKILNAYRNGYPILTLHNNLNSWYGGNGKGNISILTSSKNVRSYPAHKDINHLSKGLKDEDNLIYIAGRSKKPPSKVLNSLLSYGLNVKYEIVNEYNNDCSLSNYMVLNNPNIEYYNIETEHGKLTTQKVMIDKLLQHIK